MGQEHKTFRTRGEKNTRDKPTWEIAPPNEHLLKERLSNDQ
jgi:hypothetical protein